MIAAQEAPEDRDQVVHVDQVASRGRLDDHLARGDLADERRQELRRMAGRPDDVREAQNNERDAAIGHELLACDLMAAIRRLRRHGIRLDAQVVLPAVDRRSGKVDEAGSAVACALDELPEEIALTLELARFVAPRVRHSCRADDGFADVRPARGRAGDRPAEQAGADDVDRQARRRGSAPSCQRAVSGSPNEDHG